MEELKITDCLEIDILDIGSLTINNNNLYPTQKDFYWKVEDNNFTVFNKSRQLGFTFISTGYLLLKAIIHGKKGALVSPSLRQSQNAMTYIETWLEYFKSKFKNLPIVTEQNKSKIKFSNGGEINALPNSASGIRGLPLDIVIFDEFAHFLHGTDKAVYTALLPSTLKSKDLKIIVISTPFGEIGEFYEMYHNRDKYPDFISTFYHYSQCGIDVSKFKRQLDELSFMQEFEGCLTPECNIITNKGIKKISLIKENELVLTHNGKYHKVLKTSKRKYTGKIIKVKTQYGTEEICLTPEHPVLAIKHKRYKDNRRYKYFKRKDIEWIKSENLNEDCILFLPRQEYSTNPITQIKISDYVNLEKKKNKLTNTIPSKNKFYEKDIIVLDNDLAKLFGYYVSEGSGGGKGRTLYFSFNSNETEYINEVQTILYNKFKLNSKVRHHKKDNGACVVVNSSILYELFHNLFSRGAKNKKLPNWFFSTSSEFINNFLEAYWNGDGCYPKNNYNFWSAVTSSETLAYQIRDLLLMKGISASVNITKPNKSKIGERMINTNKTYNIRYSKNPLWKNLIKEFPEYLPIPIIKVKKEDYDGFVYNLEVEQDNTYTTSKFIVHNCFIGDINTYFPYSLLRECVNPELEYLTEEELNELNVPLYVGIDIGRRRDFTAISVLADMKGKPQLVYKKVLKTLKEKKWENQHEVFRKVLNNKNIVRTYIDYGFGKQLVETMATEYSHVVPFTFTNDNKAQMFPMMRKRFETKMITIPDDTEIIGSFHLIERTNNNNKIKFDSPKHTDEHGHADLCVSVVLANYAYEREGNVGNIFRAEDGSPDYYKEVIMKRWKRQNSKISRFY